MSSLHLSDVWRLFHLVERESMFYSSPHNVFTWIDYFCTKSIISTISGAEIHDIAVSDHAPISVSLELSNSQSYPHLWHFPSYLHNIYGQGLERIFLWQLNSHGQPQAGKAYIRGRVISYAASYKKHALTSYRESSSRLKLAQHSLSTQDSPGNKAEWHSAKRAFDYWADTLELTKHAHIDGTLQKYGNKSLCKS